MATPLLTYWDVYQRQGKFPNLEQGFEIQGIWVCLVIHVVIRKPKWLVHRCC